MSPPPFADLGKPVRDLFSKGFNFGVLKVDARAKTKSGIDLSSSCSSTIGAGQFVGTVDAKHKIKDYGLTVMGKWKTDNEITTELTLQDKIAEGLKLSADAVFSQAKGGISKGHLKAAYVHENCAVNGEVDLKQNLTTSLVLGYKGMVGGCQVKFDPQDMQVTSNSVALGFKHGDLLVDGYCNDGQIVGGTCMLSAAPDMDLGLQVVFGPEKNDFGVGCKYKLEKDTTVKAYVNQSGVVGLGFQQLLRPGLLVSLSARLDVTQIKEGDHKIGLALELEP